MNEDLDWGKVTSPTRFQRLANDLFAFETNLLEFIPSSPDVGADGGFDGFLTADIPFLQLSGKTSLQAKYISLNKQPGQVKNQIKAYLLDSGSKKGQVTKGEITKAIENSCDNLILTTNGNMTVDQIRELQSLKPKELKQLVVLSQEQLRTRIILYPFLSLYYFGEKAYPTFVPPRIYFENKEKYLNSFDIESDAAVITDKINDFLGSDDKQILHVYAPGGYGKSHLLYHAALGDKLEKRDRLILVVDKSYKSIEDSLAEEIVETQPKKYLLVLDDVDRNFTSLDPILRLLSSSSQVDIKLILTSRSSSIYAIEAALLQHELRSKAIGYKIDEWSEEKLVALLHKYNPQIEEAKARHIARHYRNPYIVSWVGRKLKGENLNVVELHDRLISQLKDETLTALTGINLSSDRVEKLLFNILAIIPFNKHNLDTINSLQEATGIDTAKIKDVLERLLQVDLFREVAGQYRANPDLKGDIYLQHLISVKGKEELFATFRFWAPTFLQNLLFNVNSASYYGDVNKLNDVLKEYLGSWQEAVENDTPIEIKGVLKLVQYLVVSLPQESSKFLEIVIQKCKTLGLNTDDIGPLLQTVWRHPATHLHAVEIAAKDYGDVKEGTYANYKIADIAKDFLNPMYNNYSRLESTLELYVKLQKVGNETVDKFILASLSEILAATHELERSYGLTISFGRHSLKKDGKIVEIRNKALVILLGYINAAPEPIFENVLEAADKIGESIGTVGTDDTELKDIFVEEQKKVINNFDLAKIANFSLSTKVAFEDFLLEWWAQEKGGAGKAWEMYTEMERDDLYFIVKSLKSRNFIGIDTENFLAHTPKRKVGTKESRWNWFVEMMFDDDYQSSAIKNIVDGLPAKLNSAESIAQFLTQVASSLSDKDWKPFVFLRHWVSINPELFKELHDKYWDIVPVVFKPEIELAMVIKENAYIEELVEYYSRKLKSASHNEVSTFLNNVARYAPDLFEGVCAKVIKCTSIDYSAAIAHAIWQFYRLHKNAAVAATLSYNLLKRDRYFTPRSIDYTSFLLGEIYKDDGNYKLDRKFRKLLITLIKRYPSPDHDFSNITNYLALSLKETLDIIAFRLDFQDAMSFLRHSEFRKLYFRGQDFPVYNLRKRVSHYWGRLKNYLKPLLKYPFEFVFLRDKVKNYDAFPTHGLDKVNLPINSYEDYATYLNFLFNIEGRKKLGLFDIDHLAGNVLLNNTAWYETYFLATVESKESEKAIFLLDVLPIYDAKEELTAKVMDVLQPLLTTEKLRRRFNSIMFGKAHAGSFSSAVGEVPKEFLDKKDYFERLLKLVSVKENQVLVKDLLQEIDHQIDSHKRMDEELLYER